MRVVFRCDMSATMGAGHLLRCRSLARTCERFGAEILFVCRNHGTGYTDFGIPVDALRLLPPSEGQGDGDLAHSAWVGTSNADDARQTIEAIGTFSPDAVVVDHYGLDRRWHNLVAKHFAAKIAVLDDLADRALGADLLVDQNWSADHRAKYAGRIGERTLVLGGPQFALLDPAHASAGAAPVEQNVASIGVFMGGADHPDATSLVLDALEISAFSSAFEIVASSANRQLENLRQRIAGIDKAELLVDLPDLSTFFRKHGLQIGAGGGAQWERCKAGAPTIAAITADNQELSLPALAEKGAALLHPARPVDPAELADQIDLLISDMEARETMAAAGRKLVDGLGTERVAACLLDKQLRPAQPDDANEAFAWRNAPETRAFFHDPAELSLPEHLAWWDDAIQRTDRHLLVYHAGNRNLGILRFDTADGEAVVSVYLDPALTGIGLGHSILEAGVSWARANLPQTALLVAEIDAQNTASIKAFASAGFERDTGIRYVLALKA